MEDNPIQGILIYILRFKELKIIYCKWRHAPGSFAGRRTAIGKLVRSVILVMNLVRHFLQVLHVRAKNRYDDVTLWCSTENMCCGLRLVHEHGSQFDEVTVFWILNFNHSPWVHPTSHLAPSNLDHLIGSHYRERHGCL